MLQIDKIDKSDEGVKTLFEPLKETSDMETTHEADSDGVETTTG